MQLLEFYAFSFPRPNCIFLVHALAELLVNFLILILHMKEHIKNEGIEWVS